MKINKHTWDIELESDEEAYSLHQAVVMAAIIGRDNKKYDELKRFWCDEIGCTIKSTWGKKFDLFALDAVIEHLNKRVKDGAK